MSSISASSLQVCECSARGGIVGVEYKCLRRQTPTDQSVRTVSLVATRAMQVVRRAAHLEARRNDALERGAGGGQGEGRWNLSIGISGSG